MEDFVSFEIAKKLKEKGFNWTCSHYYRTKSKDLFMIFPREDWSNIEERINAPTISQVLKWLREEKMIYIEIFLYDRKYSYLIKSITQICEEDLFHKCLNDDTADEEYATYEQAALAGIEYVLDNLI